MLLALLMSLVPEAMSAEPRRILMAMLMIVFVIFLVVFN